MKRFVMILGGGLAAVTLFAGLGSMGWSALAGAGTYNGHTDRAF